MFCVFFPNFNDVECNLAIHYIGWLRFYQIYNIELSNNSRGSEPVVYVSLYLSYA